MRYRRGFRRRRRSTWGYADSEVVQVNSGGSVSYCWLLPPARVNYWCDTDRVDHVTFNGCMMWLDFLWQNTGSETGLPDITLYAMVSEFNQGTTTPAMLTSSPFVQPNHPSTITSWSENEAQDGTDSYLWSHHIKGLSPPNALINVNTPAVGTSFVSTHNQTGLIDTGDSDHVAAICRKFFVAAEWQPDVHIKTRRRLRKDEGVVLVMGSDVPITSSVTARMDVRFRTLVTRGR